MKKTYNCIGCSGGCTYSIWLPEDEVVKLPINCGNPECCDWVLTEITD